MRLWKTETLAGLKGSVDVWKMIAGWFSYDSTRWERKWLGRGALECACHETVQIRSFVAGTSRIVKSQNCAQKTLDTRTQQIVW